MNFQDLILMGLKNLMRRKTRSILAITGVIIGTAAITVMMSLGIGLGQSFEEQIKSWGNLHVISVSPGGRMEVPGQPVKDAKITDQTLKEMETIPYLTAVTPIESEYIKLQIGRHVNQVQVMGVRPEVFEKFGLALEDGRLLNPSDKMGMVFGRNAAQWFYDPRSTNYDYDSEKLPVEVVGARIKASFDMGMGERSRETVEMDGKVINYTVYDAKGIGLLQSENDDTSYSVIMNIKDVQEMKAQKSRDEGNIFPKRKEYDQAQVYVEETSKVKEVSKTLKDQGYQTFSMTDILDQMQNQAKIIQAVLGGIGGISLLVAALGITNTMIMSIYERTKEIGIMKVIGADIKDIRKLFLLEAAAIGFFGGLIGIIISYGLSMAANLILGEVFMQSMMGGMGEATKISIIPWYLALGSMSFATAIGILAGYLPANRAMKLSALESLRNE